MANHNILSFYPGVERRVCYLSLPQGSQSIQARSQYRLITEVQCFQYSFSRFASLIPNEQLPSPLPPLLYILFTTLSISFQPHSHLRPTTPYLSSHHPTRLFLPSRLLLRSATAKIARQLSTPTFRAPCAIQPIPQSPANTDHIPTLFKQLSDNELLQRICSLWHLQCSFVVFVIIGVSMTSLAIPHPSHRQAHYCYDPSCFINWQSTRKYRKSSLTCGFEGAMSVTHFTALDLPVDALCCQQQVLEYSQNV